MILVAGATGALGGQVADQLLRAGRDVRVLVRSGSDYTRLVEAGATPVMGDVKDPASLERATADVTTVVTTVNSASRGGEDTIESVDRRGNRALIDAASAAGVRHFVFVSALGASPDSPIEFLRAKADAEAHLREGDMSWTVLQPDVFMEVWCGMMIVAPVQQRQPVTLVEPATSRHSFISMRDVAAFVTAAAVRPLGSNEVVLLGGPEALSWRDIVARAEKLVGRELDVQYVQPGTPLPGRPDVVSQLAAGLEMYETVIDMSDTAAQWGVQLTSAAECLSNMLRPPMSA